MFCVQTGPFSCHWVLLTSWMQIWWQQINKYLRHTEPVASNSPRVRISWGWSLVTHTMFVMRTECDTTTPFASQVSIICIMPDNVMRDPTWGNEKTKAKWRVNITRRDKYFLVLRSLFRLRFQSEILSANTVWGSFLSPALASLHSPSFMYRTPGSYSLCFLCSWVLIQFAWNSYDKIHHLTGWQGFPPLNLTSPSITAMIGKELCDVCRFVLMDWTLPFIRSPVDRFWSPIPQNEPINEGNHFHFEKAEVRGCFEAEIAKNCSLVRGSSN